MIYQSKLTHVLLNGMMDMGYAGVKSQTGSFLDIRARAKKQIKSFYKGVTKEGVVTFISPSGTTPGKFWTQKVHLIELTALVAKYKGKKTPKEIVNLAIHGDVKLFCNDLSFLFWGFKYKAYKKGYGMFNESRFPKIRNPKLEGSVCKHLEQVLTVLPFHESMITRDLKKKGVFN